MTKQEKHSSNCACAVISQTIENMRNRVDVRPVSNQTECLDRHQNQVRQHRKYFTAVW